MLLYLSGIQKLEVCIATLLFLIFYCCLRPIIMGVDLDSQSIVVFTFLFMVWYGLKKGITNFITYDDSYKSIEVND